MRVGRGKFHLGKLVLAVLRSATMKRQTQTHLSCGLLVCSLLLATGCSQFEKHWKQAGQHDYPETKLAGRWMGTWTSEGDGDSGELRCLIDDLDGGAYRASFRSTYGHIFRFDHTVTLYAVNLRGMWTFEGSEDLGLFAGGVYTYKGKANSNKLFSTYDSRHDQGTFELHRVKKDDPPETPKKPENPKKKGKLFSWLDRTK